MAHQHHPSSRLSFSELSSDPNKDLDDFARFYQQARLATVQQQQVAAAAASSARPTASQQVPSHMRASSARIDEDQEMFDRAMGVAQELEQQVNRRSLINQQQQQFWHGAGQQAPSAGLNSIFGAQPQLQQQQPQPQQTTDRVDSSQGITPENFDACVAHINTRLGAMGLLHPAQLLDVRSDTMQDKIQVLNCIFKLLQQKQNDMSSNEKLMDRMNRLQSDQETLSLQLRRTREALEAKTRDLEILKVNYSSYQKEAKKSQKKLEEENEKLNLKVKEAQQKVTQYEHTMQRMERDANKLKERMQKLVVDKGSGGGAPMASSARQRVGQSASGTDYINDSPLPPVRTGGLWKHGTERNENALYQNVVGAFEDTKHELIAENFALRDLLRQLDAELSHLRNVVYARQGIREFETSVAELHPGQFELPFGLVKGELEGTLRAKMDELRTIVDQLRAEKKSQGQDIVDRKAAIALDPSASAVDLRDVIRELRDRLQHHRRVILEQDGILAHLGSNPVVAPAVALTRIPASSVAAAATQQQKLSTRYLSHAASDAHLIDEDDEDGEQPLRSSSLPTGISSSVTFGTVDDSRMKLERINSLKRQMEQLQVEMDRTQAAAASQQASGGDGAGDTSTIFEEEDPDGDQVITDNDDYGILSPSRLSGISAPVSFQNRQQSSMLFRPEDGLRR